MQGQGVEVGCTQEQCREEEQEPQQIDLHPLEGRGGQWFIKGALDH